MPEKHASNMRSRETSIMESSSTIRSHRNRREIYNPYLQPCRTPQVLISRYLENNVFISKIIGKTFTTTATTWSNYITE